MCWHYLYHYQVYKKVFFGNGNFSGNSFLNPSFRECFGKTMPRAFWIRYLKSLCIFQNELKLQPKIPQISRKYLKAKFRGRFRQVQQVNVKEKNYGQFPEVFIKLYKKFWAISTIKLRRKKICRKTKKTQFDRVILRPGWNLPYEHAHHRFNGFCIPSLREALKKKTVEQLNPWACSYLGGGWVLEPALTPP